MSTGFYLLDNPNPFGNHFTTHRGGSAIRLVVMHTAEGALDFIPPDEAAERVSRYGGTTARQVSWHATTDSDDPIIYMLPDSYRAWHVRGRIWTRPSLGIEIAYHARLWGTRPDYEAKLIEKAAQCVGKWCAAYDLPVKRIRTKAGALWPFKGIVAHAVLDPKRRTDPGPHFPWASFLERTQYWKETFMAWEKPGDPILNLDDVAAVHRWQGGDVLKDHDVYYVPSTMEEATTRDRIIEARIIDILMRRDQEA